MILKLISNFSITDSCHFISFHDSAVCILCCAILFNRALYSVELYLAARLADGNNEEKPNTMRM